jgi:hypothetical protein
MVATSTVAFAQDGSPAGKCAFQTVNLPASASNAASLSAINDVGAIVGSFLNSDGHDSGFLLYQGKLTSFRFPGSSDSSAHDISRTGTIVGGFNDHGVAAAYMVHSGGFQKITLPGFPTVPVVANGVNDNGDVVGDFTSNATLFGFLLHNGKLTILSFPGAQGGTNPTGINDQGVVVGTYFLTAQDTPRGFMWKAGVFSNANPPDGGGHSRPSKISNTGDIVGTYFSIADGLDHGFSFDNGKYTTIDAPGFQGTSIVGVNMFDNVLVTGEQLPANGLLKGFCSAVF